MVEINTVIDEVKEKLSIQGISDSLTFLFQDNRQHRRSTSIVKLLGRQNTQLFLGRKLKNNDITRQDAIDIAHVLGRDIAKDVTGMLAQSQVKNSVELLQYRLMHKDGYFINQFIVNTVMWPNRKENHLDLNRSIEFSYGLGWDLFKDIFEVHKITGTSITDIINSCVKSNKMALDVFSDFFSLEEIQCIRKKILDEFIVDLKKSGMPRSFFALLSKNRIVEQFEGTHLYRRLTMIMGKRVKYITKEVKQHILDGWD